MQMNKMNQQQLNDYLVRENIRLQAQVNFLIWLAVDVLGDRFRFDKNNLYADNERRPAACEFVIEAIKKYHVPLVEASDLLSDEGKDQLIAEINQLKYVPPKPKKWVEGHYE